MYGALDGPAAIGREAFFPLAVIDTEAMLETALGAVDARIVAERRAARLDGFFKHGANRMIELFQAWR